MFCELVVKLTIAGKLGHEKDVLLVVKVKVTINRKPTKVGLY